MNDVTINLLQFPGGPAYASQMGMLTKRQRYQQQQRRIYERRGVFISTDALEAADKRDPLTVRELWRRCGRRLTIDSSFDRLRQRIIVRLAP